MNSPPSTRIARGGEGSGVGGGAAFTENSGSRRETPHPRPLPTASREEGGRKTLMVRSAATPRVSNHEATVVWSA